MSDANGDPDARANMIAPEAARVAEALLDARIASTDAFDAWRADARWGALLHRDTEARPGLGGLGE